MRVRYTPNFSDYWTLNVFGFKRQMRWLLPMAVVLAVLYVGFPLLAPMSVTRGASVAAGYLHNLPLLALPAWVLVTFVMTYFGARGRCSRSKELRDPREYQFDEEGIHVACETVTSSAGWEIIREVFVTRRFVYLATGQGMYFFFPKSEVPDFDALLRLLQTKVNKVTSV